MIRIKLYSARKSRMLIFSLAFLWFLLAGAILFMQLTVKPSIEVEWETETEFETAGFNIYRSKLEFGEFVQVNQSLIPTNADPASGSKYAYTDSDVIPGNIYFYRLEDVEFDNSTEMHDILSGQASSFSQWAILLISFSIVAGLALILIGIKS